MAVFPTLSKQATAKYKETFTKPSVRTKFEGNYEQTRSKFTRGTNAFTVTFRYLTVTDKATLKTFFADNNGGEFDWTNPLDDLTYTVRFKDDEIAFDHISAEQFAVTLTLVEV